MKYDELGKRVIVADIGGTFARFSSVHLDSLHMDNVQIYPCAEFSGLDAVLKTYMTQYALEATEHVAVAIACPVLEDSVTMTNCHWQFSIEGLKNSLGLAEFQVMNDFNALAMSIPELGSEDLEQIGSGCITSDKPKVVLGAGTGLGVGYLIPKANTYQAFAGEGGHADWVVKTEQEWFIYNFLKNKYPHVSYERILSGQGLEQLYQAIGCLRRRKVERLRAADIITLALQDECINAQETIDQFFSSLGSFAGDLALTFAAFGGIYLAGGIVPRMLSLIKKSPFRDRFEDKGRFKSFNSLISTQVITAKQPGLLGAAVHLKNCIHGANNA